jgi:hypothetical protein
MPHSPVPIRIQFSCGIDEYRIANSKTLEHPYPLLSSKSRMFADDDQQLISRSDKYALDLPSCTEANMKPPRKVDLFEFADDSGACAWLPVSSTPVFSTNLAAVRGIYPSVCTRPSLRHRNLRSPAHAAAQHIRFAVQATARSSPASISSIPAVQSVKPQQTLLSPSPSCVAGPWSTGTCATDKRYSSPASPRRSSCPGNGTWRINVITSCGCRPAAICPIVRTDQRGLVGLSRTPSLMQPSRPPHLHGVGVPALPPTCSR